jgi:hypothetical protein
MIIRCPHEHDHNYTTNATPIKTATSVSGITDLTIDIALPLEADDAPLREAASCNADGNAY